MVQGCNFVPGPDAKRIQESVERRCIREVWHLTRLAQLQDIFRMGALLSRAQMERLRIQYGMSGWGSEGKAEDLKDYICCSIVPPWGMSRVEPEMKALVALDPKVLFRKGVLFCGTWSSFSQVSLPQLLISNCSLQAFDIMFQNETAPFPTPPPGEFLVPHCIPITEFASRICLYDDIAREKAIQLTANVKLPSGNSVADAFRFIATKYSFRGNA